MATGDVKGNLERMRVQLRSIAYPHAIDIQGCSFSLPLAKPVSLSHLICCHAWYCRLDSGCACTSWTTLVSKTPSIRVSCNFKAILRLCSSSSAGTLEAERLRAFFGAKSAKKVWCLWSVPPLVFFSAEIPPPYLHSFICVHACIM
jgi:hypothetical protein